MPLTDENKMYIEDKRIKFKIIAISSAIWTILAHGMALFNKYSYHDDVASFNSVGNTYSSGRWMLGVLGKIVNIITGSKHVSTPIPNGVLTVVCIAMIWYMISNALNIRSIILNIMACGILISFPSVTGIFGYMFTAPYYYFGALQGVLGVYIYYKYKNLTAWIVSSALLACSVGVYQANIPICLCTLLLFFLADIYNTDRDWKTFWKNVFSNILLCIIFMAEYFIVNRLFLKFLSISLLDYKGLNGFGKTNLKSYLFRIIVAYKQFLYPTDNIWGNMFPYAAKYYHIMLVIIMIILSIKLCLIVSKQNKNKAIQIMMVMLIFPLAAYFAYVMVDIEEVHALMMFGGAFTFILAVWVLDNLLVKSNIEILLKHAGTVLIGILLFLNIRFSNVCYLKAEILQSQTISYCTTLITQIKSTEGYTDETPVVYLNEYLKYDNNLLGADYLFDTITTFPYESNTTINDYVWYGTMQQWCGFSPILGDASIYEDNEEVKKMPCYPDDGSIRYIDGQIVVKFSE